MKLFKSSYIDKTLALFRWLLLKIIRFKTIKTSGVFYIGKFCQIFTNKKSRIKIGLKSHIADYVELQSRGTLLIGKNFNINKYSRVIAFEEIIIGDNVTLAQFVTILDHDHDYICKQEQLVLNGYKTRPINIGNNVWVGDKTTILKGVNIGNNVVVGANTLVNKDVPSNCIVAGNPFKIIKQL